MSNITGACWGHVAFHTERKKLWAAYKDYFYSMSVKPKDDCGAFIWLEVCNRPWTNTTDPVRKVYQVSMGFENCKPLVARTWEPEKPCNTCCEKIAIEGEIKKIRGYNHMLTTRCQLEGNITLGKNIE